MLFSLAYNGYDHLIGQAYDGVAISLLFTLMDADLVRTACLAAPDFPSCMTNVLLPPFFEVTVIS